MTAPDLTETDAVAESCRPMAAHLEDSWILGSMLDGLPAIVYVKDLDGRYVKVSRTYAEIAGVDSPADLIGRLDEDTGMPPEQIEQLRHDDQRLLRGEIEMIDDEEHVTGRTRTGWYKVTKRVIHDDRGNVVGVFGIALDITKRRRAEEAVVAFSEQLTQTNQQLKETLEELATTQTELVQARKLEAIGQLAAGVAHEINTPIQFVADNTRFTGDSIDDLLSVVAAAESLADTLSSCSQLPPTVLDAVERYRSTIEDADVDYLREELPLAIEQTIEGTQRVSEIVRALKDFAHPANDRATAVDLNRAIESTIAVSKNEWKTVAEVRFDPDPTLPAVTALAGPLQQAVLILLVNAAQAIAGSRASGMGRIELATAHDDQWVSITVTDDGPGVPVEIRDRIFEPFFTTKAVGEGSGQGLSVAHGIIVKRHGGQLTFQSQLGKGTTFTIQIPRHPVVDDSPS